MSTTSLLHKVQQRINYVHLMSSCGAPPGSAKYEQLRSDCAAGVLQSIRSTKMISPDCAMELKAAFDELLSPAAVGAIMASVGGKVDISGTCATGAASADTLRLKGNLQQEKQIQR